MATSDLQSVDWQGRGYFAFLDREPDAALIPEWAQWLAALRAAATGNFTGLPGLIDLARTTDDPVLVQSCYYLLGDAGGAAVGTRVRYEATTTEDFELMLECCDALAARGWLVDVPVLLELFIRHAADKEASIFAVYISDCVTLPEPFPDPSSDDNMLNHFRQTVLARVRKLAEELGTAEVPVFMGQRFGVRRLAEWLLNQVRQPHFRIYWRRRFEAATGIDCTSFYKSGRFQPLAAAALLEEFLDSPAAAEYEDGVRYFFGHRIPD